MVKERTKRTHAKNRHKHKPKLPTSSHEELALNELHSTSAVAEHPIGCTCAWCQYWADSSRAFAEEVAGPDDSGGATSSNPESKVKSLALSDGEPVE